MIFGIKPYVFLTEKAGRRLAPRQRDGKHNPVVFAGGTDGTAVQANDFLRDCKAEPGPAACAGTGGVEAEELLEKCGRAFPSEWWDRCFQSAA